MDGKTLLCSISIVLFTPHCIAQTRWCSITGLGPGQQLSYPPIARAAHVTGAVIERITFEQEGRVRNVEAILGPPLLEKSVRAQLEKWTVTTDASGKQLCQALIVADFAFGDSPKLPGPKLPTSVYVTSIRTTAFVIYDAMPTVRSQD